MTPMHDAARDAAYRALFSRPRVIRDLLVGFVPEDCAHALDFDTLEKLSPDFADAEDVRQADEVWRVRMHKDSGGGWLYVLLMLELQSTDDPMMALHILVYTGLLYEDLLDREEVREGELPLVLPIVLYNGEQRWTAPQEVRELFAPLGEGLVKLLEDVIRVILSGTERNNPRSYVLRSL